MGCKGVKIEAPQTHAGPEPMKEDQRDIVWVFIKTKGPDVRLCSTHTTPHTHVPTPVAALQVCGGIAIRLG